MRRNFTYFHLSWISNLDIDSLYIEYNTFCNENYTSDKFEKKNPLYKSDSAKQEIKNA